MSKLSIFPFMHIIFVVGAKIKTCGYEYFYKLITYRVIINTRSYRTLFENNESLSCGSNGCKYVFYFSLAG